MQTFDSRITRFYCGFSKIKALFQSKFGIDFFIISVLWFLKIKDIILIQIWSK